MAEMMVERLLLFVGFPARRFIGNGDVAQHPRRIVRLPFAARLQRRKRQHVGRLVDPAPVAIQRLDAGVVGQHDRELAIADVGGDKLGRGRNGTIDRRLGFGLGLPAVGDDKNLGDWKGRRCHQFGVLVATDSTFKPRARHVLWVAGRCGNPS